MIWLIIAILLPVTVSAVLLCTSGEFVNNNVSTSQAGNIIINAIFVSGLASGVVEEMVFRGMIMKALEKRWGKIVAIILPSVIFALIHVIGRDLKIIDILILLVAGTSVGIMFSLIVYESGSVWPGALVHGTWNAIMIGKILDISVSYHDDAIFSYKLSSKSLFFTGGGFGVESSLAAILGYIVVLAITLFLMKRKVKVSSV
jgi:membrane protease YdiL (CAAX protease family)